MKLSTVAEALNSQEDEPVLAIRGTLTKLYNPMKGEGQYGPWTLQNGMLKDDTGEIKVVFDGRAEVLQDWRGKVVELRCSKAARGGFSGIKFALNKKTKIPELKISDKAEVVLYNGEQQPEPPQDTHAKAPAKAANSPQEPPQPAPKVNTAPPAAAPAERRPDEAANLAEGISRMYQIMNCQLAAIAHIHEYLVPAVKRRTGQTIDAQQEAALVQNLCIQMYYEKSHYFFPGKPYKTEAAPPPNGG